MQLLPWSMMFTFFKAKIHFLHILRIFKVYFAWIFVHFRPFYLNFGLFFNHFGPVEFLDPDPASGTSQPASKQLLKGGGGGGAIFSSKMAEFAFCGGFLAAKRKSQLDLDFLLVIRYQPGPASRIHQPLDWGLSSQQLFPACTFFQPACCPPPFQRSSEIPYLGHYFFLIAANFVVGSLSI